MTSTPEKRQQDLHTIKEMMAALDRIIYLCDNEDELLLLAASMLVISRRIYAAQVGDEKTNLLMKRFIEGNGRISLG